MNSSQKAHGVSRGGDLSFSHGMTRQDELKCILHDATETESSFCHLKGICKLFCNLVTGFNEIHMPPCH